MPQKSSNPRNTEPGSTVPQDQDDELEMAEDDEDLADEEDGDTDELEDDDNVEE